MTSLSNTKSIKILEEKLNNDANAAALGRIMDRLDDIENNIKNLSDGFSQAPSLLSIMADSVDEQIRIANNNGINVDERLKGGLAMLGRLTDPHTVEKLNGLIDFAEQAPGLGSMMIDSVDEAMGDLKAKGIDVNSRINSGLELLLKITDPQMMEKLEGLMQIAEQAPGLISMAVDSLDEAATGNQLLDPKNFEILKKLAEAYNEAQQKEPAKVNGIFSLLRTMKDPEVSKATGFLVNLLKAFGNKI